MAGARGKKRLLGEEMRRRIHVSGESISALARRYGLNRKTVSKWKNRASPESLPPGRKRLCLTSDERALIARFASANELSLDESLRRLKKQIPHLTRSTLYRCLEGKGAFSASLATGAPHSERRVGAATKATTRTKQISLKRQRILDLARKQFLKYGYNRTSMSAIASELGGSRNLLWQIFPSKDALFNALITQTIMRLTDDLTEITKISGTARGGITTFVRRFLAQIYHPEWITMYRLIVGAEGKFNEVGVGILRSAFAANGAMLRAFLVRHMEAGNLRRDDPDRALDLLIGLCNGRQYTRAVLGLDDLEAAGLEDRARKVVDAFFFAYAPLP